MWVLIVAPITLYLHYCDYYNMLVITKIKKGLNTNEKDD